MSIEISEDLCLETIKFLHEAVLVLPNKQADTALELAKKLHREYKDGRRNH